jgi:hypothetical protein
MNPACVWIFTVSIFNSYMSQESGHDTPLPSVDERQPSRGITLYNFVVKTVDVFYGYGQII